MNDPAPYARAVVGVVANDDPIAMLVLDSSGGVRFQYVEALDTLEGIAWLQRRLSVASTILDAPECRVSSDDETLVCQSLDFGHSRP